MFLHWNVDPILFTIPVINLSLRWYGLFFAVGFPVDNILRRAADGLAEERRQLSAQDLAGVLRPHERLHGLGLF